MSIKNKHRKFSMTWFIILIGVFVANATQNNSFDFDVNVTGKGTDDDFDYEERLKEIHTELHGLNEEAKQLAQTISNNFKALSI